VLTAIAPVGKITALNFNILNSVLLDANFTVANNFSVTAGDYGYEFHLNKAGSGGSENPFKADGDGFFDVAVTFNTGGDTLDAGETFEFTISGITESAFYDVSVGGPVGKNGFPAAIKAQDIGAAGQGAKGEDSGWYTGITPSEEPPPGVPAPAGLILMASAMPLLVLRRAFRRKETA
jgi:hypothetical protein